MSRVYSSLGCAAQCGRCAHTIKNMIGEFIQDAQEFGASGTLPPIMVGCVSLTEWDGPGQHFSRTERRTCGRRSRRLCAWIQSGRSTPAARAAPSLHGRAAKNKLHPGVQFDISPFKGDGQPCTALSSGEEHRRYSVHRRAGAYPDDRRGGVRRRSRRPKIGNQQFQEIHQALLDNLVIFFRDQTMTIEQHGVWRPFRQAACASDRPQVPIRDIRKFW